MTEVKQSDRLFRWPVLVGPTGVGKSEIAFHLARILGAEILSADAFQVYRGLSVGTAQPPAEWRRQVPHHLVDCRDPGQKWSAAQFAREASEIIGRLRSQGKNLVIVGGSGFYLQALVEGIPAGDPPSAKIRDFVSGEVEKIGNEKAHQWLREIDPAAAARLHVNDRQRICRALEKSLAPPAAGEKPAGLSGLPLSFFGLERSRENLDRMLRVRVDQMWNRGLKEETRKLEKEADPGAPAWKAIGYGEMSAFLKGQIPEETAKEKMFRRTRQYAKRQWTWFKHHHEVRWIDLDQSPDAGSAAERIKNFMDEV